MNNKIYSLMALGAILFAAACSDNVSPISGSTSVPNMDNNLNIPQSPVLCSVIGVTDSLEALEKGCIWSPEMWSRTSGYRVRTGFDNGTNTSGIWTWHVEQGYYNNVRFDWPGIATAEYDSMALADVIDKCGGSLCGKIVYEPIENKIDSAAAYIEPRGSAYVEFYFAGKDALGNIGEANVSSMQGICIEYSGNISSLELLPNDSIANLNKFSSYNVNMPYFWNQHDGSLPESKEVCFPWYRFALYTSIAGNQEMPKLVHVSVDDVVAHLKGVRFNFLFSASNTDFNIISIGRYHLADIPTTNLHPVDETCEPIAVLETFCDCDFSEEKANLFISHGNYMNFEDKKYETENDSVLLSDSSKQCIKSTLDSLRRLFVMAAEGDVSRPCDNPQPHWLICADGTESESIEFAEKQEEFGKVIESLSEGMIPADSLFAHCMSLSD